MDKSWTANALNQITQRNVEGTQYVTGPAASPPSSIERDLWNFAAAGEVLSR